MNSRQKILLTAGLLGAAAAVLCVRLGWGSPAWWALPAFVAAVTAAEFATVRMVIGRQGYSVALTDAFVAIGFVLAPGAWIPLGVLLAFLLANARRSPWIKLVFNLTQYPCAIAAGLLVTQTLGSGIAQAAVGLVVFACLNYLLVAIPIAITAHRPYAAVVAETSGLGMIHVAGNISLGLLAAWLAENAPLGLLGLVVPLVLLWWSYRQQTERTAEARLFAELARGREQIAATSVDTSAHVLLTAAARLFGGAEVEMLLRHPDGPVRYVGDEHGVIRRERRGRGSPLLLGGARRSRPSPRGADRPATEAGRRVRAARCPPRPGARRPGRGLVVGRGSGRPARCGDRAGRGLR